MPTALYDQMLAFNYKDDDRAALMRKVWKGTPWMVDAFSDGINEPRHREMIDWCFEQFGPEAWPIHDRPGRWQRGCATVHGWTWFGFSTEAEMDRFVAQWPAPEGVEYPGVAA